MGSAVILKGVGVLFILASIGLWSYSFQLAFFKDRNSDIQDEVNFAGGCGATDLLPADRNYCNTVNSDFTNGLILWGVSLLILIIGIVLLRKKVEVHHRETELITV